MSGPLHASRRAVHLVLHVQADDNGGAATALRAAAEPIGRGATFAVCIGKGYDLCVKRAAQDTSLCDAELDAIIKSGSQTLASMESRRALMRAAIEADRRRRGAQLPAAVSCGACGQQATVGGPCRSLRGEEWPAGCAADRAQPNGGA